MGLRVNLKMPAVTSEDVFPGFSGLTVVFARRNETTPATLMQPPATAIVAAMTWRATVGIPIDTPIVVTPHMAAAISSAMTGGGTLSSSAFM